MNAFVLLGPREGRVQNVPDPVPTDDQVVVDVARVGVCGTDIEFFDGEMEYLRLGLATYPMILGHEWCGRVSKVGRNVDPALLGARVTGDTMLGCQTCPRCTSGKQHLCADRYEIGIRGGWHGALAEQLLVPAFAIQTLPAEVDDSAGAMVEPGANALRAVEAGGVTADDSVLVLGAGTIGLLAAMFARARGAHVTIAARSTRSQHFARSLAFESVYATEDLPSDAQFDVVINGTNSPALPDFAVNRVDPGGRIVLIGLAPTPALVDNNSIALNDLRVTGVLSGSGALEGAISAYASGAVDPRPLIAATIGLDEVGQVLKGQRPLHSRMGPKTLIDPKLRSSTDEWRGANEVSVHTSPM